MHQIIINTNLLFIPVATDDIFMSLFLNHKKLQFFKNLFIKTMAEAVTPQLNKIQIETLFKSKYFEKSSINII